MDLKKLCAVADSKKLQKDAPTEPVKKQSFKDMFKGVKDESELKKVKDDSEYKRLKDEYDDYVIKSEKTIEDLENEKEEIQSIFETETEKSERTIKRLNELIDDLKERYESSPEIRLSFKDNQPSIEGDDLDKCSADDLSSLCLMLKGIFPDKKVVLVFDSTTYVKDSEEGVEFKQFCEDLDKYIVGDIDELPAPNCEKVPEKAKPFVKEVMANEDHLISQEAYSEYSPAFKEAVSEAGVTINSLPLLADAVSAEVLQECLSKMGPSYKKVFDSIVGTPDVFKVSRKKFDSASQIVLGKTYLIY